MELSVVTVTWNSEEYIVAQLHSVQRACAGIEFEQIVVDNASGDKTVQKITEQCAGVRQIVCNRNFGFGAANNEGLKLATGEFILFLNPDCQLPERGMKELLDFARLHPEIGIIGPRLVLPTGESRLGDGPRRFPTIYNLLIILCKLSKVFPRLLYAYYYAGHDWNVLQTVDTVRGSCMLVRRELISKLGGHAFDSRYFIWFEDVDLCREAQRLGFRVVHYPAMIVTDYVGRSFVQRSLWWKQWQFINSMVKYIWKWL